MKILLLIFSIVMNLFLWPEIMSSQIEEYEATPSVLLNASDKILITEVNLKNSEADWIKFKYISSQESPRNIRGIKFQDDKIFKEITTDTFIQPHKEYQLTFKSDQSDQNEKFFTNHSGLTATTEQIILIDQNNKVLDAICWANEKPTEDEIKDQKELWSNEGWSSEETNSCFPSTTIKKNDTLKRKSLTDSNTSADWELQGTTSKNQRTTKTTTSTRSTADIGQKSQKGIVNPTETKNNLNEKPLHLNETNKVQSTSPFLKISEIYPNPTKGTKEVLNQTEWFELTNYGETPIKLSNWSIKDTAKSAKPYSLSHFGTLEAGQTLWINAKEAKISLANQSDGLFLLNSQGKQGDEVTYESAPKNKSYALLETLDNETGEKTRNWQWTSHPTPNEKNPECIHYHGIITEDANFDTESYFFTLQTHQNETFKVLFTEETIPATEAQELFKKNTQGTFLIGTEEDEKILLSYEITQPAPSSPFGTLYLLSSLLFFAILGTIFWIIQKKKKSNSNASAPLLPKFSPTEHATVQTNDLAEK